MFAVIKTGGKQYSVESGKIIKVEKIIGKKGDSYIFDKVLIIGDASSQTLGNPIIKGAKVEATIIEQIRDKKIIVFKKIRRQNYRRTKGHRQWQTVLKINKILNNKTIGKTKSPVSKEKPIKKTVSKNIGTKKKKTVSSVIKKKTIKKKTVKKKPIKISR
tara:strand:- start:195 stop:674 length:480 start_codon:yes stop_codon:yes gene_type:complete